MDQDTKSILFDKYVNPYKWRKEHKIKFSRCLEDILHSISGYLMLNSRGSASVVYSIPRGQAWENMIIISSCLTCGNFYTDIILDCSTTRQFCQCTFRDETWFVDTDEDELLIEIALNELS